MRKSNLDQILAGLPEEDPRLAEILRLVASRVFWLLALLVSSGSLIVITLVIQWTGIRPSDPEWHVNARSWVSLRLRLR